MLDTAETFNRAIAAYTAGRLIEAEHLCQQIIAARHDHFEASHVLAVVQAAQNKFDTALTSYDRALALRPDHADVLSNRGNLLLALNRAGEALASYDRALASRPNFPEALSNRGSALERLGRLDEALASYDRALALRPDFVDALFNRGNALRALKRYDEAMASYDRALALRPGHAEAHNNRGQVLRQFGRFDEALASYDAAVAARPQYALAHANAAAMRLLLGDFERGWEQYEWRWTKPSVAAIWRNFKEPLWRGEPIEGRTILIHAEQGLGDTIQFCRYVPLVAARAAQVIFEVQPPLLALMREFAKGVQVVAKGEALPVFDLHCPLLSLPLAFRTSLQTVPAPGPYLHAPPQASAKWQARLPAGRARIGLVWSGNPNHERDRERSVALRRLLPLLGVEASFVSLQKEVRPEDEALLRARTDILHAGPELTDFADTAGLVSALDLVISVDTSVAHIAAALGKPTWILLTQEPDWRWLLGRDDSPWYASLRLFRQEAAGHWDAVIERVCGALVDFVNR